MPWSPATEIFNVSEPEPPVITSPGCSVVPAALSPCNNAEITSSPDPESTLSAVVANATVFDTALATQVSHRQWK